MTVKILVKAISNNSFNWRMISFKIIYQYVCLIIVLLKRNIKLINSPWAKNVLSITEYNINMPFEIMHYHVFQF